MATWLKPESGGGGGGGAGSGIRHRTATGIIGTGISRLADLAEETTMRVLPKVPTGTGSASASTATSTAAAGAAGSATSTGRSYGYAGAATSATPSTAIGPLPAAKTLTITLAPDWNQHELKSSLRAASVCVVLGPADTSPQRAHWKFEFSLFARAIALTYNVYARSMSPKNII